MEKIWMRNAPYTPAMFSDPFAYRSRLSDGDLDFDDEQSRLNNTNSVRMGLITQEEADRRNRERHLYREKRKEEDRYLEVYVDVEWDTSDDSIDEDVPITPPYSPKYQPRGPDLSIKAWKKECSLIHLRKRFDIKDFGFEDYETWKQYQIKHAPQPAISHISSPSIDLLGQNPPVFPPLRPRLGQNTCAGQNNSKP
ncbi:MAG: hypothetical protein M1821_004665 [Bathelium mastoideum]|nr:MAG: hypothetical protein M1821_004665 [Bathelium mastoideum]